MSITGLEFLKMWQEGFASGNSDTLSEIITDDFKFVGQTTGTRNRQETLDWVSSAAGMQMSDPEVLYENHEVLVCIHTIERGSPYNDKGRVMAFARKEGDKLSYWTVVRGNIPN